MLSSMFIAFSCMAQSKSKYPVSLDKKETRDIFQGVTSFEISSGQKIVGSDAVTGYIFKFFVLDEEDARLDTRCYERLFVKDHTVPQLEPITDVFSGNVSGIVDNTSFGVRQIIQSSYIPQLEKLDIGEPKCLFQFSEKEFILNEFLMGYKLILERGFPHGDLQNNIHVSREEGSIKVYIFDVCETDVSIRTNIFSQLAKRDPIKKRLGQLERYKHQLNNFIKGNQRYFQLAGSRVFSSVISHGCQVEEVVADIKEKKPRMKLISIKMDICQIINLIDWVVNNNVEGINLENEKKITELKDKLKTMTVQGSFKFNVDSLETAKKKFEHIQTSLLKTLTDYFEEKV